MKNTNSVSTETRASKSLVSGDTFVSDAWLAEQIQVARSTIRVQRHLRLQGKPHWLNLDPVYIGSLPRYRVDDVRAWLNGLHSSGNLVGRHE